LNTVARWSLSAALVAILLAALATAITPPPAFTADAGLAGWPRLGLYALAGIVLGLTAPQACLDWRIQPNRGVSRRAYQLVGLGIGASLLIALVNAQRLRANIGDALGPALWLVSMLVLLGYSLFPLVWRIGWRPIWPEPSKRSRHAWLAPLTLVILLALAATIRLVALGDIPQGINPDEGDRASTSIDLLNGTGPQSWFDSGWFFINMIYFRVLAASLALFGRDVFGGRMLTALAGIAFVAVIAWIGWRNFGPRLGLLATAFAACLQMYIQHSRLITEAGLTALLWAISIGAFLEATRTGRLWAWVAAGLCGGLSLYFYPSARLWAIGAALTALLILLFFRDRRLLPGIVLAALASVIAVLPFLVHLSQHPDEVAGRYAQTAVLDPSNQVRLAYLQPPEPVPELLALQVERTVGLFDRYPDGGGFMPTNDPLFGAPLAQLALVGSIYLLVRGVRDIRLAVLALWFWLGLSGVALTVETPDYLRAAGILPSLCFVLAVPLLDLVDRALPMFQAGRREMLAGAVPASIAVVLLVPEVGGYFGTFRTMPSPWTPETHEGQVVAANGATGPVYSIEMQEHTVNSGWVRLLAPKAERGRVPNPGRELPFVAPVGGTLDPNQQRPNYFPDAGQGFYVLMTPDPNQRPYIPLLQQLYPEAQVGDGGGDQRQSVEVSAAGVDAVSGVTAVDATGATRAVNRFGEVPTDLSLPTDLSWHAGVRLPTTGNYQFDASAPGRVQLKVDGIPVADGTGSASAHAQAAGGLHFVELEAPVGSPVDQVKLLIDGSELGPNQTYRLMDAPWGLLMHLGKPTGTPVDTYLDSTVSMAFLDPELSNVGPPNSLVWSGTLLAPRTGTYRMAFASEDTMHLQIDGQPVQIVTIKPDGWANVGEGTTLELTAGPHPVQITLDVTHGGRELARWNWVPPLESGAVDTTTPRSVVPPQVLRPDPPISLVP
jgi:hypothetical protein